MECEYCNGKALYRITAYYADDEYGGISKYTVDTNVCRVCLDKMDRMYYELEYEKP